MRVAKVFCLLSVLMCDNSAFCLSCPPGTEYRIEDTSTELRSKPYFPLKEEFCVRVGGAMNGLREGPYILWGPNGEKQLEGNLVEGQKDGTWIRQIPSQTVAETWEKGRKVGNKIVENTAQAYTIDFETCAPHAYGIPAGLGHTSYKLRGPDKNECVLEYSIGIERGQGPKSVCRVPRSMGKQSFRNTDMGLKFFSIKKFCSFEQ